VQRTLVFICATRSPVATFARTLKAHRKTLQKLTDAEQIESSPAAAQGFVDGSTTQMIDDLGLEEKETEDAVEADEDSTAVAATVVGAAEASQTDLRQELTAVDEMLVLAEDAARRPDARVRWLIAWIKANSVKHRRLVETCRGFSLKTGPGVLPVERRAIAAFIMGLAERGLVQDRDFVIEYRYGDNRPDRLAEVAAELLHLKADVLVTVGTLAPLALTRATSTIPIVLTSGGDPVGSGLVDSLARPGGNVTGAQGRRPPISSRAGRHWRTTICSPMCLLVCPVARCLFLLLKP
jgi:ABC transporter substrate binding protein